ncbi:hypothetical protein QYE76_040908 [Lolium multiflorum]|uniref:Uncharacterized protein n=1 Tax=Lolium multiflorum TaxID=4521 RepID=A0AAD8TBZ2_LOLMU|nr:hypothetical protein QYE76_040908 [Lolium multiflorum]
MVERALMDLVAQSDVLNKPITPDNAADLEALEATRKEMLATAKKFANTAAAMLDERKEAANFVVHFQKKDREIDESLAQVKQLRKHWEAKMTYAQQEDDRIIREAIPPRKITFATPTEQQPLTTQKDNMKKAAELLKKKDEEIDINYTARTLASAMQAEQGDTSRRRKVREHPNPIPVPSDSTPRDPAKGKGPMYADKDKYRNPSPPPRIPRPPLPPRRCSPAGNTRPHGPGGINIRNNMPPPRNRSRETQPGRSRNDDRELGASQSRNEGREPEPRRSRTKSARPSPAEPTMEATVTKRKVPTGPEPAAGRTPGI